MAAKKKVGRRPKMDTAKARVALEQRGAKSIADIASEFGVSAASMYNLNASIKRKKALVAAASSASATPPNYGTPKPVPGNIAPPARRAPTDDFDDVAMMSEENRVLREQNRVLLDLLAPHMRAAGIVLQLQPTLRRAREAAE